MCQFHPTHACDIIVALKLEHICALGDDETLCILMPHTPVQRVDNRPLIRSGVTWCINVADLDWSQGLHASLANVLSLRFMEEQRTTAIPQTRGSPLNAS